MKFIPLNFDLMKSPLNWATILLMIAIGAFALDEIFRFLNPNSTTDCGCRRSLFPVDQSANTSES